MNILDTIVAHKILEVQSAKLSTSVSKLEKSKYFHRNCISLRQSLLLHKCGIIAEFKRKSPSKGVINAFLSAHEVTTGYAKAGAKGLSILTDNHFFGGKNDDIEQNRDAVHIPILRKEFIIDEYQIIEAKAMGADVILLIAACLSSSQTVSLAKFVSQMGMETLLEVHNEEEYNAYMNPYIHMVGVNNRNLKNFEVNIETSLRLADVIDKNVVKIAESGLNSADEIKTLIQAGFKGFLIGESFMKTKSPAEACKNLINEIS
ncbi:MAG: indole-3-glycerol phosphate synthase TrpC [Cytophagales bacterium]|nr:indole-3-glycerol phosphate synthase TrpC [Cytophagales bacterium]